jgi:probable rRNA maturation factor
MLESWQNNIFVENEAIKHYNRKCGGDKMKSIGHKIYVRHDGVKRERMLPVPLLKGCIRETLRLESVDFPCEVSVVISNNNFVRKINREFRNIDKVTDVLSFPFMEFTPGNYKVEGIDEEAKHKVIPIGDVIISAEKVHNQAAENGHSPFREAAYLVVHSTLHLLGYDHIDEAEDKKLMRSREKVIMEHLSMENVI